MSSIPDNRSLRPDEVALIRWLLEHGEPAAAAFLRDLEQAQVVSRCGCGCASVDFAITGRVPQPEAPLTILSDYQFRDSAGQLGGVFVFAKAGQLAGIEVWSVDGLAQTDALPPIEALEPLGSAPAT